MRIVKPSSESEMIYELLKMEIESERYSDKIKAVLDEMQVGKNVILNGDINSEQENTLRAEVLKRFRGYPDEELFDGFPTNIKWFWTVFDNSDLSKIIYINYSYWNELSDYTGSPLEAAKTIRAGKIIYDVPNDNFIKGAEKIKAGHKFPPLIFLTDEAEQRYVILEGHGRMTAYGLAPELFQDVPVLLGICNSRELDEWYGEEPVKLYEYDAIIRKTPDMDGAYIEFPYDIRVEFGKGRVKVHATFDGEPYDGSIVNMGVKNEDGSVCYIIGITKALRAKIGKQAGENIKVTIRERES